MLAAKFLNLLFTLEYRNLSTQLIYDDILVAYFIKGTSYQEDARSIRERRDI
jgi:hypothetical protein